MTRTLEIDYAAIAIANGWVAVPNDPTGESDVGPCLYHADQDRVWPLDDPKGACEDLGVEMEGGAA